MVEQLIALHAHIYFQSPSLSEVIKCFPGANPSLGLPPPPHLLLLFLCFTADPEPSSVFIPTVCAEIRQLGNHNQPVREAKQITVPFSHVVGAGCFSLFFFNHSLHQQQPVWKYLLQMSSADSLVKTRSWSTLLSAWIAHSSSRCLSWNTSPPLIIQASVATQGQAEGRSYRGVWLPTRGSSSPS